MVPSRPGAGTATTVAVFAWDWPKPGAGAEPVQVIVSPAGSTLAGQETSEITLSVTAMSRSSTSPVLVTLNWMFMVSPLAVRVPGESMEAGSLLIVFTMATPGVP